MKKVIAAALTVVLLFSATACKNVPDESGVQTGSDTAESGVTAAAEETAQAALGAEEALSLLNCRANEDGTYSIDQTAWSLTDDYELFRRYFFGAWEGGYRFPEYPEQKRLIIDDTEKSFVMSETGIRVLDGFYETEAGALAFMVGNDSGSAIIWISPDKPDTLYMAWGGTTSPLWSRDESGAYSDTPVVYTMRKTNEPLSEPESDFLSIFRLREMAREYGIDTELLVDIEYESDGTTLYHDDWYQFYPMYLVSETEDKIVIRTTVGNVGETAQKPIDVICTFEKSEGEWSRSVELL